MLPVPAAPLPPPPPPFCSAADGRSNASRADVSSDVRNGTRDAGAKLTSGALQSLEQLLRDGAHVNAVDQRGWTPLHEAARAGRVEVLRLLVEAGAATDTRTTTVTGLGGTPLWWATETHGREHAATRYLAGLASPPAHDEL